MGIFSSNKKITEKPVAPVASKQKTAPAGTALHGVLIAPRVTEKATDKSGESVYVFNVSTRADKTAVARAIKGMFKVRPIKVAIVPVPRKVVTIKGKRGSTARGKKAYVYLKKGETIEFI